MARRVYSFLAIASFSAAKPINLLGPALSMTPAASSSLPAPLSLNQTINEFDSTLNVSAPLTICYNDREQADLIPDQCMEALVNSDFASLPPLQTLAFASRSSSMSIGQIGLPRRYLSSDGRCAIEPYLLPGVSTAYNTPRHFNQAANEIIERCVNRHAHAGGVASDIGGDNNLRIEVFNFKPKVQCYGSANRQRMVTSCNNLANKMKASFDLRAFVSRQLTDIDVLLPETLMDPAAGRCRLEISFDKSRINPVQYSSWFTIWQVVVAINAMCIRNGQSGRWLSVGYSTDHPGIIDVDVSEAQPEEQDAFAAATA